MDLNRIIQDLKDERDVLAAAIECLERNLLFCPPCREKLSLRVR